MGRNEFSRQPSLEKTCEGPGNLLRLSCGWFDMLLAMSSHRRKEDQIMRMLALCLAALVSVVPPAAAQTVGKWEIEFHSGGVLPSNPTAGTVTLPGPGQVFTT